MKLLIIDNYDSFTYNLVQLIEQAGVSEYVIVKNDKLDKVIITLYYYEELSIKEIAEITELSVQNIKIKLYRSRQKLFKDLNNRIN